MEGIKIHLDIYDLVFLDFREGVSYTSAHKNNLRKGIFSPGVMATGKFQCNAFLESGVSGYTGLM